MAREALTGSRIRERRVMAGMKQANLAREIGISASYLNLIEHNRRRIGGKLLLNISAALGVEPQALTEGAEAALIGMLREAADDAGLAGDEIARVDEFAGRFPGWADVLAGTRRRVLTLEQTVEALTDRLAHDPHLAASMHELLTTAAAIRSTASILAETETLQPEWQERFHANINEDSQRLADSTQALVSFLESDGDAAESASSPQEEVEAFLAEHDFSFDQFDGLGNETADEREEHIDHLISQSQTLTSVAARYSAKIVLGQMARDATVLPLAVLRAAIAAQGSDPLALSKVLRKPPVVVMRRMAALPELGAGLVVCDRAGSVIFRKSVEGFTVPRHGACCPLWPLFSALSQVGMVVSETVVQLGRAQAIFDCFATSEAITTQDYNHPPLVQAVMLLLPAAPGAAAQRPMGSSCRICSQERCQARREPSILSAGV